MASSLLSNRCRFLKLMQSSSSTLFPKFNIVGSSEASRFESARPFHALSGLNNSKAETDLESSILGNRGVNVSLPYSMIFRSCLHSGKPAEVESGRMPGSMDYVQELVRDNNANFAPGRPTGFGPGSFPEYGRGFSGRRPFHLPLLEKNADIVHIKLMRNNAFVTLTDSKGNKKKGISAAKLAGKGGKLARYSGEAAAENMGREAKKMKTKSVVVKVNGYTFFRRKKDAILGFKDGYTDSRAEASPIVYIEDTTRKPHNGCRRRKQRRI